jgi:hypothetical protein
MCKHSIFGLLTSAAFLSQEILMRYVLALLLVTAFTVSTVAPADAVNTFCKNGKLRKNGCK